jgi:hypothetical protein
VDLGCCERLRSGIGDQTMIAPQVTPTAAITTPAQSALESGCRNKFKLFYFNAFAATLVAEQCFGYAAPASADKAIVACFAELGPVGSNIVLPIAVISSRRKGNWTIATDNEPIGFVRQFA